MPIIYNTLFPFGKFYAINICGLIFCRSDKGRMTGIDKNHEYIHTLQQKEMLFVGFYLWYVAEWLVHLCRLRDGLQAYRHISLEREAYDNQTNLYYRKTRKPYAWRRYLERKRNH